MFVSGVRGDRKMSKDKISQILIKRGSKLLNSPRRFYEFTKNKEADKLLNNIEELPHAFVLACVMDRQIPAERAWSIPYLISKEIGGFEFKRLLSLKKDYIRKMFLEKKLHRFNEVMSENFYLAIQKIKNDYNGDASNIWKDKPKSATVVRRFLEFNGVGIKIATMITNILVREFKIPMKDYICIDISPDIHVKRVFKRIGFIPKNASNDELIFSARELNPNYPGVFDLSCWEIGRKWCRPNNPNCKRCYLNKFCKKNF